MHARTVAVDVARTEAQNVTFSLARQTAATLGAVDGVLRELAERAAQRDASASTAARLADAVRECAAALPSVDELAVADTRGRIAARAGQAIIGSDTIVDRPFFRYHAFHDDPGVVMTWNGNSATRSPVLLETRRLNDRHGHFAGVAIASLSLAALQESFADLRIGERGAVALFADDGTVLARRPRARIGERLPALVQLRTQYAQYLSASVVMTSPVDGTRRLIAFEQLAGRPLTIETGLAEREYLAGWRADALANYVALGFATAVIGGLACGLAVQIRRRKRAEDALALLPIDIVTGLASRGRFDAELAREWRLAEQQNLFLGMVLINVENLKAYNERVGRELGDELLLAIAQHVTELSAPGHFAARFSGLQLALLLPSTDDAAAQTAADTLRRAVTQLVAHLTRRRPGTVRVAVGAAALKPTASVEPATLIDAARSALRDANGVGPSTFTELSPDVLTGLANRRHFDAELERAWKTAASERTPFGLLVIEIDNLKAFNDRCGHEAGDELLIALGRSIESLVTPQQLAARYDGLRFAVLLPGYDAAAAQVLCNRFRAALVETVTRLTAGLPATPVAVIATAVSRTPQGAERPMTLIDAAFMALGPAKLANRS